MAGIECGEEEDRAVLAVRLRRLDDVSPVSIGQTDVQDDHVDVLVGTELAQCFAAVMGYDDVLSGLS